MKFDIKYDLEMYMTTKSKSPRVGRMKDYEKKAIALLQNEQRQSKVKRR